MSRILIGYLFVECVTDTVNFDKKFSMLNSLVVREYGRMVPKIPNIEASKISKSECYIKINP